MRKCIKCLAAIEVDEYVVNKYMSYCEECAKLLHLGESKESRTLSDFHVTGRQPPAELQGEAGAAGPQARPEQPVPAGGGDEEAT